MNLHPTETAPQEKTSCKWFLLGIIPSLLIGTVVVPTELGATQYLASYTILFITSCVYTIVGLKNQNKRQLAAGATLIWTAPFIPILILIFTNKLR